MPRRTSDAPIARDAIHTPGCIECGKPVRVKKARLCSYHYELARTKATICVKEGCRRPQKVLRLGLCGVHYDAVRLGSGCCSVPECRRPPVTKANPLCNMHYKRLRRSGVLGPAERLKAEDGAGSVSSGYRVFTRAGRKVREHRMVMERSLGRQLLPNEFVHHKNGDRADNRRANLELWIRPHPSGQRLDDLIGHDRAT